MALSTQALAAPPTAEAGLAGVADQLMSFIRSGKPGKVIVSAPGGEGDPRFIVATTPDGRFTGGYVACERRRPDVRLHLSLVLDVSGSMTERAPGSSQTKLDVALQCIENIRRSPFMSKEDMLTVFIFSKVVHLAWEGPLQEFDHQQLMAAVKSQEQGLTAARDGVLLAMQRLLSGGGGVSGHNALQAHSSSVEEIRYVLAFTDGADNASFTSVDRLEQEVAQTLQRLAPSRCFFKVIAAGLGAGDRANWARICRLPSCELVEIQQASDLNIRDAFNKALLHMRLLIVRNNETDTVSQVPYAGDLQGAHAMDLKVTGMLSNLLNTNSAPATGIKVLQ